MKQNGRQCHQMQCLLQVIPFCFVLNQFLKNILDGCDPSDSIICAEKLLNATKISEVSHECRGFPYARTIMQFTNTVWSHLFFSTKFYYNLRKLFYNNQFLNTIIFIM